MKTSIMVIMGPEQDQPALDDLVAVMGKHDYEMAEIDMRFKAFERMPHTFGAVFNKKQKKD